MSMAIRGMTLITIIKVCQNICSQRSKPLYWLQNELMGSVIHHVTISADGKVLESFLSNPVSII